ncbi:hypothetical protein [Pseudomonas sp. C1C7]|uniref:hypothetical protein n=1 Tax=Pseudomonas sp. C1C7 TaxID=2735272 RepID=UPI001585D6AF|nr:hypothetical protein [Pseudomonas sp. C1C7]
MTSVLVLRRRVAVFLDTKGRVFFGLLPVCQLVGCACQIAWQGDGTSAFSANDVLCRRCRRLRSFDLAFKNQNQKIAAFGSSYRGAVVFAGLPFVGSFVGQRAGFWGGEGKLLLRPAVARYVKWHVS